MYAGSREISPGGQPAGGAQESALRLAATIVEYRSRKVSESILRVQSKSGTQQDLAATNVPPPAEAQPSPQHSTGPTVEIGPNKSKPSINVQPAGQASASPSPKTRDTVVEAAVPAPPPTTLQSKRNPEVAREGRATEAELHQSRSKVSEVEEERRN